MVFLDTPGIHKPLYRLNQRMVRVALEVLDEVDLVFFLVEATEGVGAGDRYVVERLKERAVPVVLVINKVDLVQKGRLLPLIDAYRQMHEFAEIVPVSALTGDGVNRLVEIAVRFMPAGPVYFEDDVVTDQPMQLLAAEFIREKILQKTRDELPFSVAVQIESFTEEGKLARIAAIVYVEKESQKPIVIGSGGALLKQIGTSARVELEKRFPPKVFLELFVKVAPDWRDDREVVRALDYRSEGSG